jgi:hypothetical protein
LPEFDIESVRKLLDDPYVPAKEKSFFYEYLTLIEFCKSNRSKNNIRDNKVLWQKALQKEFEQKQHDSILAAHYLHLKDYYKEKNYEKYAKRLMKMSNLNFDLSAIRELKQDQPHCKVDDYIKIFEKNNIQSVEVNEEPRKIEQIGEPSKAKEASFMGSEIVKGEEKNLADIFSVKKKRRRFYNRPQDYYNDMRWRIGSKLADRGYDPNMKYEEDKDMEGEFYQENPYLKKKFEELKFKGVCVERRKAPKSMVTTAKNLEIKKYSHKWNWTLEGELDKARLREITKQRKRVRNLRLLFRRK